MSKPWPNPPLMLTRDGEFACSIHGERDDFWCHTCLRVSRAKQERRNAQ